MFNFDEICTDGKYRFIYLIKNNINGNTYVGQHTTKNLRDRYFGSGSLLIKAIKEYGKENFELGYLVFCENSEELNEQERIWVKFFKEHETRGNYNIAEGGLGGNSGWKPTQEWKDNISEKLKEYYKNNPVTEEERKIRSNYISGHKKPESFKKSVKERQTGETNSFYDHHHSEETKHQMRKSHNLTPKIKCEFCDQEFDAGNFKKYHGENCKLNPNRKKQKEFLCEHCGYIGNNRGTMIHYHWDNCKNNIKNEK